LALSRTRSLSEFKDDDEKEQIAECVSDIVQVLRAEELWPLEMVAMGPFLEEAVAQLDLSCCDVMFMGRINRLPKVMTEVDRQFPLCLMSCWLWNKYRN
jgi:hypothetical protein